MSPMRRGKAGYGRKECVLRVTAISATDCRNISHTLMGMLPSERTKYLQKSFKPTAFSCQKTCKTSQYFVSLHSFSTTEKLVDYEESLCIFC
jgi:hypothetical protein